MGDPAGIGPEVALRAWPALAHLPVRLIGHRALLERVAARIGAPVPPDLIEPAMPGFDAAVVVPGQVAAACGLAAAACIEDAIAGCLAGRYAAMVTGPINKLAIHAAGVPFPGHTEWLAARCGVEGEVMMLHSPALSVLLITCHQSLASVAADLAPDRIVARARLFADALRRLHGRPPRLAVLGFNPHAGEGGLFGDEERAIVPAIAELLNLGIDTEGPLPPDTAFTPANRKRFDGFVCMYHDQALIPFKALAFDEGVNVTLGLPIVRTSVDHGTAFDIAWQGKAEHRSLIHAVLLAASLSAGLRPATPCQG